MLLHGGLLGRQAFGGRYLRVSRCTQATQLAHPDGAGERPAGKHALRGPARCLLRRGARPADAAPAEHGGMTTGWKLDRKLRESLLEQLPPRYPEVISDHVTLDAKAIDVEPPPVSSARIVGRADDNRGVEAMVVELEGSLDRPDGSTWHVTWSLGPGR